MGFYKKILVLKQTESGFSVANTAVSGICRVEIENGVAELYLTIINILPKNNSNYKFMLVDSDKKTFSFDCAKRPSSEKFSFPSCPNIKNGFAVGLYAVNEGIPLTVAFACEEYFSVDLASFKRLVAEKCLNEYKLQTPAKKLGGKELPLEDPAPVRPPYPPAPQPDPTKTPPQEFPSPKSKDAIFSYDDEAVATTNYFEFDEQIEKKLCALKEWEDEPLRLKNEPTSDKSKEETMHSEQADSFFENEENASFGEKYSKSNPYFKSVEKELNAIFSKFENQTGLENLFPQSRWAKINYSKNKFYVVGLIKEQGREKYICYGVPAKFSLTPPKELKGFCTFIPLSIFDLSGDGFWMMFQDAVSGECIKPKPPFD